jgi:hypothetical protein
MFGHALLISATLGTFLHPFSQTARTNFVPEEATISSVHAAFGAGQLTCVQLVQAYLDRIEAYDKRGPALNSIITINPRARTVAQEMDGLSAADRSVLRSLHCVPVILKDNYDTADMPTTGGSVTLAESIPPQDAFIVKKLREAGGLIIAKANLTELARGGTTVSSFGGQTKNPYDLTRTPGGSSVPAAERERRLPRALRSSAPAATQASPSGHQHPPKTSLDYGQRGDSSAGAELFQSVRRKMRSGPSHAPSKTPLECSMS